MNRLLIDGGKALSGRVGISGSKNGALACIGSALLTGESTNLTNIPQVGDVKVMLQILCSLGISVTSRGNESSFTIKATSPLNTIPQDLSTQLRGSLMLLGGLLARTGKAELNGYGGCTIGERPIDLHIHAFAQMGAKVKTTGGTLTISASRLKGADIDFRYPSVGATVNAAIAACLADGVTTIRNAAIEPEIMDMAGMLEAMGASIVVRPSRRTIRIEGSRNLGGVVHRIIPDRIEAGTYACAAVITGSKLILENTDTQHLTAISDKLRQMGVNLEIEGTGALSVDALDCQPRRINIRTAPYPGFPTDMQPQMVSVLTKASGRSRIAESVFESRFGYINELRKMGANIETLDREAVVCGPSRLRGAEVVSPDLRGGAALVLAGLAAEGVSRVGNIDTVDRGYEAIEDKLRSVGADIERERDE